MQALFISHVSFLSSFQGLSFISCLEDEAVENYTNIPDYGKLQRKFSHVVELINIGDTVIVVKGTRNLSCLGCIVLVISSSTWFVSSGTSNILLRTDSEIILNQDLQFMVQ